MANGTLAGAVNQTAASADIGTATALLLTVLLPEMLRRLFVFVAAPFLYPEMWWLLVHLLLTFVLFEFYFERHVDEKLGWSAALANSIVMIFIGLELIRALYHHEGTPLSVFLDILRDFSTHGLSDFTVTVALCLLLVALGVLTALINYFHLLPRAIAWLISGHKTVNLLAYFLIVVVFRATNGDPMPLDGITLSALVLFGALLWSLLFMINHKLRRRKERKRKTGLFG